MDDVRHAVALVLDAARTKKLEPTISAVSTCLRMAYYKTLIGTPMTMKIVEGIDRHAFFERHMRQAMEKLGYTCEAEADVTYGPLHGRADMTCQNGDSRYVIELKFTANPTPGNPFYPFWTRQLKYYVALLTLRTGHRWIGYLVATDFDLTRYYIEQAEVKDPYSVYREAEERHRTLVAALRRRTEPPREVGNWCRYCRYSATCLNDTLHRGTNTLEANADA